MLVARECTIDCALTRDQLLIGLTSSFLLVAAMYKMNRVILKILNKATFRLKIWNNNLKSKEIRVK